MEKRAPRFPGLRPGIGRRLIVYILLFSSAVTFVGTSIQLYIDYAGDIKSIEKTLDQIAGSYLESISFSLWHFDENHVKLQLDGILRLPDMQYLEIRQNDKAMISAGLAQAENIIERQFPLSHVYDNRNVVLGTLHATASLTGVYNRLFKRIIVILSTQTVKTFLVTTFIFFLFYFLIGRHLYFTADYLARLDYNHLDLPLNLKRRPTKQVDELDQLALSINAMRTNLARYISERKRAAEELYRLNAELTHKNRELEQIVYVASHDLRSPLVNVQGFSRELLLDFKEIEEILGAEEMPPELAGRILPILKEDIPEDIRFIMGSIDKMDSLMKGLLRISRLGRDALDIRPLNMTELVSRIVSDFEYRAKEENISIRMEPLPDCLGDETQIYQVFQNLVANAAKFMSPRRDGSIRIFGYLEEERSVYCVEDNGIGIAREHQQIIFEIFHQLDPHTSDGDGLGLNIVKMILDRHEGKTWIESEPEKGSRFFVSLPRGNVQEG